MNTSKTKISFGVLCLLIVIGTLSCTRQSNESEINSDNTKAPVGRKSIASEMGPKMLEPAGGHYSILLANGDVLLCGGKMKFPQLYRTKENRFIKAKGPAAGKVCLNGNKNWRINGYQTAQAIEGLHLEQQLLGAHQRKDLSSAIYCYIPNSSQILVAGGVESSNGVEQSTRKARMFNLTTGKYYPVGDMLEDRDSASTTLLPDGRVLIYGGETTEQGCHLIYSSTEIYDPKTRSFSKGPATSGQSGLNGIVRDDGLVLLPQLTPFYCESVDVLHTQTMTIVRKIVPHKVKLSCNNWILNDQIVDLKDGRVLFVFFGKELWILDKQFNLESIGTLRETHYSAGFSVLPNGKVLVTGGYHWPFGDVYTNYRTVPIDSTELIELSN